MMVQWLTYAALLRWRVVIVAVVESSQNLREAMDTDAARDRTSMVRREAKKMTPRVLPHVSELEIMRSWKCEDVMKARRGSRRSQDEQRV